MPFFMITSDTIEIKEDSEYADGGFGSSASLSLDLPGGSYISENRISFWINLKMPFPVCLKIFKDTGHGKDIANLIQAGYNLKRLERRLFMIALKNYNVELLLNKIKEYGDERFNDGMEEKKSQLRVLIGIEPEYPGKKGTGI